MNPSLEFLRSSLGNSAEQTTSFRSQVPTNFWCTRRIHTIYTSVLIFLYGVWQDIVKLISAQVCILLHVIIYQCSTEIFTYVLNMAWQFPSSHIEILAHTCKLNLFLTAYRCQYISLWRWP